MTQLAARELHSHRTNKLNERLRVFALDQHSDAQGVGTNRGFGVDYHYLLLHPFEPQETPKGHLGTESYLLSIGHEGETHLEISNDRSFARIALIKFTTIVGDMTPPQVKAWSWHHAQFLDFQTGSVKTEGVTGTTHEVLLAVLLDRLEAFQTGEMNEGIAQDLQLAINSLEYVRLLLMKKTIDRQAEATFPSCV